MWSPSSDLPPQGCTNFKVRRMARLLSRHYDAALAEAGLKTTQYSLLKWVLEAKSIAPGELAQRLGMDPSTLTRNLRPMLASGWLVQSAGKDARSRQIGITEEGCGRLEAARPLWKAAQTAINARLGVQRVAALHELLDECDGLLRAGAGTTPPRPAARRRPR
jgi:DNA-binding MarR family transcriptional regulator